jgi:hypothetical protein
LKLKVPQPLQRRHDEPGRDVDLREDSAFYDTAEHDVYVTDEPAGTEYPDEESPSGDYGFAERNGFDGTSPSGGAGRPGGSGSKTGRPRFDIRSTWQVLAGSILIPVGVASIILAWYGAAHARVDQQQIPYLISGGFLGLGAIIAGALMYWAHWLYRIYDQADLQHQQFMRSQAEIRDALLGMAGGDHNRNGSVPGAAGSPASRSQVGSRYVATASGSNFHRPDCPIVARRPNGLHEVSGREAEDLQPCRICEPLAGQA